MQGSEKISRAARELQVVLQAQFPQHRSFLFTGVGSSGSGLLASALTAVETSSGKSVTLLSGEGEGPLADERIFDLDFLAGIVRSHVEQGTVITAIEDVNDVRVAPVAASVDGVILLVRTGKSQMTSLGRAIDGLRRVGGTVVGTVVTEKEL